MGVLFLNKQLNEKYLIKSTVVVIFLSLIVQISNAQKQVVTSSACPNPNGGERAHFSVRHFLTAQVTTDARVEAGATNETVEQIRPIADVNICSMLSQIVNNTPKYANVDNNLDVNRTKYYYRTNNFYYIFWNKKPEYDNLPNTGPKKLFIVVSADYQNIWEYYF